MLNHGMAAQSFFGGYMYNKIKASIEEAIAPIKDNAVIMVGGFMACGTPEILMDALVQKGVTGLTVICNDAGLPGRGVSKLLENGQIKKLIASRQGVTVESLSFLKPAFKPEGGPLPPPMLQVLMTERRLWL
jgi:hypothetical protein